AAPVAYRFKFTTSRLSNFFHQLHSFQDETWRASQDVTAAAATAVAPATAPGDQEARDYSTLASQVLGSSALQDPPEVQVTRLESAGAAGAFVMRSPEPIDWWRTSLTLSQAPDPVTRGRVPEEFKLTDVRFAAAIPNDESVTLLLREAADLT